MSTKTSFPTRPLGRSGMHITRIGLGAWAIGGNGWAVGWGPQDDADSIAAIRLAVDRGINWIDTAAVYGLVTPRTSCVARWRRWRPAIGPMCSPNAG